MRLVDRTGDGDFNDYAERQFFLANWRGDISAIMTPSMTPGQPGIVLAKVRYDAYGKPTMYHPADFDRDGLIGGSSLSSEYQQDLFALGEALLKAPYDNGTGVVKAELRAWRAFANLAAIPPPEVGAGNPAWQTWKDAQTTKYVQTLATLPNTVDWAAEFGNLPLYASYWFDAKLGLYHVRHRVYDPNHGRWLQRDPIGYAGGNNLYGYGPNSPHMGSDPMGLDWLDNSANFAAGFADNLSFGLTYLIREAMGANETVNTSSGYYIAGAVTETVVELIVTGGSVTLAKQAAKATARAVSAGMKTSAVAAARQAARRAMQKSGVSTTNAIVHHVNVLLGHPGTRSPLKGVLGYLLPRTMASRAGMFPTLGLPGVMNSVFNLRVVRGGKLSWLKQKLYRFGATANADEIHNAIHYWQVLMEKTASVVFHPGASIARLFFTGTRVASSLPASEVSESEDDDLLYYVEAIGTPCYSR